MQNETNKKLEELEMDRQYFKKFIVEFETWSKMNILTEKMFLEVKKQFKNAQYNEMARTITIKNNAFFAISRTFLEFIRLYFCRGNSLLHLLHFVAL